MMTSRENDLLLSISQPVSQSGRQSINQSGRWVGSRSDRQAGREEGSQSIASMENFINKNS